MLNNHMRTTFLLYLFSCLCLFSQNIKQEGNNCNCLYLNDTAKYMFSFYPSKEVWLKEVELYSFKDSNWIKHDYQYEFYENNRLKQVEKYKDGKKTPFQIAIDSLGQPSKYISEDNTNILEVIFREINGVKRPKSIEQGYIVQFTINRVVYNYAYDFEQDKIKHIYEYIADTENRDSLIDHGIQLDFFQWKGLIEIMVWNNGTKSGIAFRDDFFFIYNTYDIKKFTFKELKEKLKVACHLKPQKKLYDENGNVDTSFLANLLNKRIVIIGEMHHVHGNIAFQTQVISYLNKHGYQIIHEYGFGFSSGLKAAVVDSTDRLFFNTLSKLDYHLARYKKRFYKDLINRGFDGNWDYFDFDGMLRYIGFIIIYHPDDFLSILQQGEREIIELFYKKPTNNSKKVYDELMKEVYKRAKKLTNQTYVQKEFIRNYEGVQLFPESKKGGWSKESERGYRIRERMIKKFISEQFPIQDTSQKYVFIMGRSHTWLNNNGINNNITRYIVEQAGRENVCIIGSYYVAKAMELKKIKSKELKDLNISAQEWRTYEYLDAPVYIKNSNLFFDYIILLLGDFFKDDEGIIYDGQIPEIY